MRVKSQCLMVSAILLLFLVPASAPAQDGWVDLPIASARADASKVTLSGSVNTGPGWAFRVLPTRVGGTVTIKLQGKPPANLGTTKQNAVVNFVYLAGDMEIRYKIGQLVQAVIR